MHTVHKFLVKVDDETSFEAPFGARVVHLAPDMLRTDQFWIWCIVDTTKPIRTHTVYVRGTGHPLPPETQHVGSVTCDVYVWHVFA